MRCCALLKRIYTLAYQSTLLYTHPQPDARANVIVFTRLLARHGHAFTPPVHPPFVRLSAHPPACPDAHRLKKMGGKLWVLYGSYPNRSNE